MAETENTQTTPSAGRFSPSLWLINHLPLSAETKAEFAEAHAAKMVAKSAHRSLLKQGIQDAASNTHQAVKETIVEAKDSVVAKATAVKDKTVEVVTNGIVAAAVPVVTAAVVGYAGYEGAKGFANGFAPKDGAAKGWQNSGADARMDGAKERVAAFFANSSTVVQHPSLHSEGSGLFASLSNAMRNFKSNFSANNDAVVQIKSQLGDDHVALKDDLSAKKTSIGPAIRNKQEAAISALYSDAGMQSPESAALQKFAKFASAPIVHGATAMAKAGLAVDSVKASVNHVADLGKLGADYVGAQKTAAVELGRDLLHVGADTFDAAKGTVRNAAASIMHKVERTTDGAITLATEGKEYVGGIWAGIKAAAKSAVAHMTVVPAQEAAARFKPAVNFFKM